MNLSELASMVDVLLDASPERRAAIIEELSAGDEARRLELERFLEECEREPTLLGRPAAERFAALLDPADIPASLAGSYRLIRELGRGGMATVYLVHDLKHDRPVALKVLHRELAAALGPDRFLREIRIAAGLHHPLILPVFDSGSSPGIPGAAPCLWYTMPFVEGESLRDRLDRESPLAIDEAVRIGCEVADALGHAHARGVIHRDVKPENILLSEGHALLADFGIARALNRVGEDRLTETGLSLGTPAYMSPEQAVGDDQLDCRTDLYSLACVLYEMLSGQPPFTGSSSRAIMARHAIDPVPSLRTVRSTVPVNLEAAIRRALSKVPADRFESAADLIEALTQGTRGSREEPFPGEAVTRPVPHRVEIPLPSPPTVQTPSLALVGRTTEWECLTRAWRGGQRGPPRCLLVSGVAGIGKTRLAEEFVRWAAGQSAATATSRCYGTVGRLPYAPLADWLRSPALRDSVSALPQVWRAEIRGLLPEVGFDSSATASGHDRPQAEARHQLFEAVVRAIGGAPHPLLLFIDDIQWADRDTLEWIRYFLRSEDPLWVLVIATLRLGEVPLEERLNAILLDLRRDGRLEEISLEALDVAATAALGGAVAGAPLDPAVARALHRETEGHPLYIVEMMRSKAAEKDEAVTFTEPSAHRASGAFGARRSLPQRVLATIEGRLGQLSPTCRKVVGVAAVIGREFRMDLLAEGSGVGENDAAAALDELLERRLVREQSDGSYDFGHASIREVAYAGLSSARRRLLHQRVAQALIASAAGSTRSAAAIAQHLEQGGLVEEAIRYRTLAADVAGRIYAYEEAVSHLNQALALVGSLPESAERDRHELALQIALGPPLRESRGWAAPEIGEMAARAWTLGERVGSQPERMRVMWELVCFRLVRGTGLGEALEIAEAALQLALGQEDSSFLTPAYHWVGAIRCQMGEFTRARECLGRATELYDRRHHAAHVRVFGVDYGVLTTGFAGHAFWHAGQTDQALALSQQALGLAEVLADPFSRAIALAYDAMLHQFSGTRDAVEEQAAAAIAVSTKYGFPYYLAWGTILHGWAVAERGQVEHGIAEIREGLAAIRATGCDHRRSYYLSLLAQVCGRAGQVDEGLGLLQEALTIAETSGEHWMDAELYRLKGELLAVSGAPAGEVHRMLLKAVAIASRQGSTPLLLRAEQSLQRH
jgi:serine/threonine protein kinase/tetratricopeptide (TPR) repeat protein